MPCLILPQSAPPATCQGVDLSRSQPPVRLAGPLTPQRTRCIPPRVPVERVPIPGPGSRVPGADPPAAIANDNAALGLLLSDLHGEFNLSWQGGDMAGITGLTGWVGIVLNAPDARSLAYFYRDLFGWPLADDDPDWCTIRVPGAPANLAFQTEEIYERPTWPATAGKQQMMLHLDIGVRDLAAAVEDAVELGAALPSHQPQDDVRVLLDPAGHPFCLYIDRD